MALDERDQELLRSFNVREGRIIDPGKFEGQPAYTPYFHRQWIEGLADQTDGDSGLFYLHDDELRLFPELSGKTLVVLYEDDQGQVTTLALDHTTDPD